MVDFHTHILPGMDDGSSSVSQTLEMLQEMHQQKISTVVATPHFDMRKESIDDFLKRRDESFGKLQECLLGPKMILGAEVLLCGSYLHHIEGLEKLCIGRTRYMLIEGFTDPWGIEMQHSLSRLMTERNIIPILAHMERYYGIPKNREIMYALWQQGAVWQMNAQVLLRRWTRRFGLRMLRKGFVQVLGSDCHDMQLRPPNLGKAVEVVQRYAGMDVLHEIEVCSEKMISDEKNG